MVARGSGNSRFRFFPRASYTLLDRKVFQFYRLRGTNPLERIVDPFLIAHSRTCEKKRPRRSQLSSTVQPPIKGNSQEKLALTSGGMTDLLTAHFVWKSTLNIALVCRQKPQSRLIKEATYPAPNPLSMFTTVTLEAQEFIIPSNAAKP
jgi:hypothetical protein